MRSALITLAVSLRDNVAADQCFCEFVEDRAHEAEARRGAAVYVRSTAVCDSLRVSSQAPTRHSNWLHLHTARWLTRLDLLGSGKYLDASDLRGKPVAVAGAGPWVAPGASDGPGEPSGFRRGGRAWSAMFRR